jgi:UDP-3-O-[3-hydroxymyristoyl] glucosamine N-acyltransferase
MGMRTMEFTIQDIAKALGLSFVGDPNIVLKSIAPIDSATANQLSFVTGKQFAEALQRSQAGVVILPESLVNLAPSAYMVSSSPYLSYAKASHLFYPPAAVEAGVHSSAIIHSDAIIAKSASIGPKVVVESGAQIGKNCVIGAGCFIGEGAIIGDATHLFANVTIYHRCVLGQRCRVQSGAVIGGEGFGYVPSAQGWHRINQVGAVSIADDVEIGANTTIDRGALGDTIIEEGVILDNQIQIAHNVRIGKRTAIAGCTGIAGSTIIGKNCTIAGSVNIVGHLNITDNVHLTATSFVMRSISEPGRYSSGMPLETNRKWLRTLSRLTQLDLFAAKLRRL